VVRVVVGHTEAVGRLRAVLGEGFCDGVLDSDLFDGRYRHRRIGGVKHCADARIRHRVDAENWRHRLQESTCHYRAETELDGRELMTARAHHRDRPLLFGGMNEQRPRRTLPSLVPRHRRMQVPNESLSVDRDAGTVAEVPKGLFAYPPGLPLTLATE